VTCTSSTLWGLTMKRHEQRIIRHVVLLQNSGILRNECGHALDPKDSTIIIIIVVVRLPRRILRIKILCRYEHYMIITH
jgi:hypothetical protein